MRQDASKLLERLNRRDFNYRQFDDPFADMELWPIFEALLTDERVVATRTTRPDTAEVRIRSSAAEQVSAPLPGAASGLFRRYAQAEPPPSEARAGGGEVVSLRPFLAGLTDKR